MFFYSILEKKQDAGIFDDSEPDFLYLLPNHTFAIPQGGEENFIKKNVPKQRSQRSIKSIMIASFKDTITVSFLKYLKVLSEKKENKISLRIRMALPEERDVIKHKVDGKYYKPERSC